MSDKLDLIRKLATENKESQAKAESETAKNIFLKNRKIIVISVAVIFSVISVWALMPLSSKKNPKKKAITQKTQDIKKPVVVTKSNITLSASGYVNARRIATIAAEITGKIVDIYFEEGQYVTQGQLLAKLDDTLAITEKESAIAQLESAKALVDSLTAKHRKAEFSANSKSKLYKSKVISEEVYIQSQADVDSLAADLAKAKNDVEIARIEIERRSELVERHLLKAPFAGVITSKDAHPGEVISPISGGGGFTRTGIATIVDMNSLEVEVDVNESNINKVLPNQPVKIILEAYQNKSFDGNVLAIIPSADRDKATIKVRIGFNKKEDIILPNMAVKVDFLASEAI